MNFDQRLRMSIGNLVIENLMLHQQLEDELAKEAKKPAERADAGATRKRQRSA